MKNKIWIRMFTVLMAALVMMGDLPITAYAGSGEETAEERRKKLLRLKQRNPKSR